MKTTSKLIMMLAIVLSIAISSCTGNLSKEDADAIQTYVDMNNSPASAEAVKQAGIFKSFDCRRDGANIEVEFVFIEGVDLAQTTDSQFEARKSEVIIPIRNDYANIDAAKQAIDAMKTNGGAFVYIYKDSKGVSRSIEVKADEI